MVPPARFAGATFESYKVQQESQQEALETARSFSDYIRRTLSRRYRLRRALGIERSRKWLGLYMVGPVGTGKTHLLTSMYHVLHPSIPCAFMHSSTLFRIQTPPEQFAHDLASRFKVLCLDEVEIDDPANEARLLLILKSLMRRGVFLLATSNVEPEKFLSTQLGNERFRRFLNETFRDTHQVVVVGGDDYRKRLPKIGRAFIGEAAVAETALRRIYAEDERPRLLLTFPELLNLSLKTEHTRLIRKLSRHEALYLSGITIRDTDEALRLLRILDDLYHLPAAPVLYYSSTEVPDAWFGSEGKRGLEKGIAEKFKRTTSRLNALCAIERV